MRCRPAFALAVIAAAVSLSAGCSSSGSSSSDAAATPSSQVEAAPSSDVGSAEPSSGIGSAAPDDSTTPADDSTDGSGCTSHTCIADTLEQSLTGLVAEDNAVSTDVKCYVSSVKYHKAADTYSASCIVTYSDGSQASGTGNLVLSSNQATFQPSGT